MIQPLIPNSDKHILLNTFNTHLEGDWTMSEALRAEKKVI